MSKDTDTDSDGRRPYTLRLPHWHAGEEHPAGTILRLRPAQIERVRAAEDRALTRAKQAVNGRED